MTKAIPNSFVCLFSIIACCATGYAGTCPIQEQGETELDCPWAGTTRELLKTPKGSDLKKELRAKLPRLHDQIASDARQKLFKSFWGSSINYDELAKDVIVDPTILRTLGEIFGVKAEGKIVHAGLEHTYGYLFSNLKTPFGYKRTRWVRPTTEDGFRLPKGTLGPLPEKGSLFSNVTCFTGRIAFRQESKQAKQLARSTKIVAPAVVHFPYDQLRVRRLTETVLAQSKSGKKRTVTLRTDLVSFLAISEGEKNSLLLIYSVKDELQKQAQLITAFPVEKSFADKLFNPAELGANRPVTTRYNGFVEGVTGQTLLGSREVHE